MVDARVEQNMYTATPYIPTGQENEPTILAAEDSDDPQNDLEIIQNKIRNGCDCNKHCYHQFSEILWEMERKRKKCTLWER